MQRYTVRQSMSRKRSPDEVRTRIASIVECLPAQVELCLVEASRMKAPKRLLADLG